MPTLKSLAIPAAVAVCSSAACAQILGIDPDPYVATTTATGGGATTTGPAGCTPGDAGRGDCPSGRFCDPGTRSCVLGCTGTLRARITTDSSGTAQDIAAPYNQAIYDYLRDLRDSGGLRGCAIDVDMEDGHYDATVTSSVVSAWAATPEWPEVTTLFIFGTGPTMTVTQMSQVAGKVIIPGSYAGAFTSPAPLSVSVSYPDVNATGQSTTQMTTKTSPGYPYVFFPATDYSTGIRIGIHAAWQLEPGKIAMVYDKTCAYCTDPLVAGKSYVPSQPGMELAPDIDSVPQTSDASQVAAIAATIKTAMEAELTRFEADSSYHPVKWLWCGNSVTSCAGVAKGAGQANAEIKAQISDPTQAWKVRVIANNWGIGETASSLCGTAGSAADCDDVLYGLFPVPRYGDTTASGMQAMMALHDRWSKVDTYDGGPNALEDVRFVQGYAAALMWRKAVEAALDAGHTTPTGGDLKTALEQFDQIVLEGMTAGPISFTKTDHRPQGFDWVYYLHQGVLTLDNSYSLTLDPTWLGY